MSVETVATGFQNGLSWACDHDEAAGTIGVTVTGTANVSGRLVFSAEIVQKSDGTVVDTIAPVEIGQYANAGRQVLYTNSTLKHMSLLGSSTDGLDPSVDFEPA